MLEPGSLLLATLLLAGCTGMSAAGPRPPCVCGDSRRGEPSASCADSHSPSIPATRGASPAARGITPRANKARSAEGSPVTAAPAGGGAASARVTGTVTYLQRIALPPAARIKVQLVDVSRAGAPAVVLAERLIAADGKQVPFAFEIPYDPAKIDPRYTYAVQARIEDGGKLLFISDQRYAVITRGAPKHVEMVLRAVGGAPSN